MLCSSLINLQLQNKSIFFFIKKYSKSHNNEKRFHINNLFSHNNEKRFHINNLLSHNNDLILCWETAAVNKLYKSHTML